MSCSYKQYSPETDGPSYLYHRMNEIDCDMKMFGGTIRKKRNKKRTLRKQSRKSRRRQKGKKY